MANRESPVARAMRVAAGDERRVLADIERAQRSAGLSDEDVGRACRMSRWMVARMVRGTKRGSVTELARLGAAVGLDVRLQAYVAGDAIRDAGQLRLLARLHARLHPALRWQTEVPLPILGDRRAWDAVIGGGGWSVGVEAETVLDDLQAVERRLAQKRRDGGLLRTLLLVADTWRNRAALASAPLAFADLDRDARHVLRALGDALDPGRDALVAL